MPSDWDYTLPSDVALQLPGHEVPTILLSDWTEVRNAGYERANDHRILFCQKLTKARKHLHRAGAAPGTVQQGRRTEFFEIQDTGIRNAKRTALPSN